MKHEEEFSSDCSYTVALTNAVFTCESVGDLIKENDSLKIQLERLGDLFVQLEAEYTVKRKEVLLLKSERVSGEDSKEAPPICRESVTSVPKVPKLNLNSIMKRVPYDPPVDKIKPSSDNKNDMHSTSDRESVELVKDNCISPSSICSSDYRGGLVTDQCLIVNQQVDRVIVPPLAINPIVQNTSPHVYSSIDENNIDSTANLVVGIQENNIIYPQDKSSTNYSTVYNNTIKNCSIDNTIIDGSMKYSGNIEGNNNIILESIQGNNNMSPTSSNYCEIPIQNTSPTQHITTNMSLNTHRPIFIPKYTLPPPHIPTHISPYISHTRPSRGDTHTRPSRGDTHTRPSMPFSSVCDPCVRQNSVCIAHKCHVDTYSNVSENKSVEHMRCIYKPPSPLLPILHTNTHTRTYNTHANTHTHTHTHIDMCTYTYTFIASHVYTAYTHTHSIQKQNIHTHTTHTHTHHVQQIHHPLSHRIASQYVLFYQPDHYHKSTLYKMSSVDGYPSSL
eukprot:GHVR01176581.1.p1 GENE.GHVR01176581.1~~GHVR01176581.1.p1  ORF type:complete len:504 (-),score=144.51 GHVR01176581.1:173-1684(-)